MSDPSGGGPKLDPEFRERLLAESKSPFQGLRRGLWIALFGSAGIGLFIMGISTLSGKRVLISDLGIQISAFLLFGALLWLDRRNK